MKKLIFLLFILGCHSTGQPSSNSFTKSDCQNECRFDMRYCNMSYHPIICESQYYQCLNKCDKKD